LLEIITKIVFLTQYEKTVLTVMVKYLSRQIIEHIKDYDIIMQMKIQLGTHTKMWRG